MCTLQVRNLDALFAPHFLSLPLVQLFFSFYALRTIDILFPL
jgi:hypothetical protein